MAHNPPKDLADYLDTNTTALTIGTNLFYGPERGSTSGVPVDAVFVKGFGGPPPQRTFGTSTSMEIRRSNIQVMVRSDTYLTGLALARTIYGIVQSATSLSTSVTYMDVQAQQTEPIYLGMEYNREHLWSLNFTTVYQSS